MVPDYDDDDIVEDYEEVSTDSPVRRVNSAQGGPVQRPSGGVRPSTAAMPALSDEELAAANKGKITQKSAKMIWIVCIAVCVLGVGAVLVDMLVDPLGRHKAGPAPANNDTASGDNTPRMPPRRRDPEMSEHQKLAQAFGVEANKHYKKALGSRAYDFTRMAMKEMNEKFDTANEDRNNEALWAEAWVAYYRAEYAVELYYHVHNIEFKLGSFKPVPDFRDISQCEILTEEELKDPEAQRIQGVVQAISGDATKIGKHKKQLLGFVVSANVLDKEEFNASINEAKAALTAARESDEFAQQDVDYVNRDPRGPDEPPPYLD